MAKPAIPQGTRDFAAVTVARRQYITQTIREVFELYGFQPLETPAMENLDTLIGKYGEEGDKLLFRILNNGLNDPKNHAKAQAGFDKLMAGKASSELTERALRYDLTIPFARYVAMHHGELTFPYKRYQIQPVWRADRPQKGRYREFTQCDADVVGSNSLLNECDLARIYHHALTRIGLNDYSLRINNRKILSALARACGGEDLLIPVTIAIDKLEKAGWEKVKAELQLKNLSETALQLIETFLNISGTNHEKLTGLEKMLGTDQEGAEGIKELTFLTAQLTDTNIRIDPTLARGLNYYTGTIFEVKAPDSVSIGSIGGGGRYDDLTGLFGVPNIPGVGISFGVDRIYDVLETLDLFPKTLEQGPQILLFNLGEQEVLKAMEVAEALRNKGVACEVFPDAVKMDKQFRFATRKNIPYAGIIGSRELEAGEILVKQLETGHQKAVPITELSSYLAKQSSIN